MEWLPLKGKVSIKGSSFHHASTKKNRLLLKGLVSTAGSDFHQKQRLGGKNGWFPLK